MASNLNPANAVTASRFLTLPPFVWAVGGGYYQLAAALITVCALLDLVDGAFARIFDCATPFGAVFDAIADGVCYGFFILIVTIYGWAPWPPVAIILGLGVLNMALRTRYARRAGRTVNYRSYAMERCVAYAAYLGGFAVCQYEVSLFYWAFAAVMGVTMVHDAKRTLVDPIDPPDEAHAPADRRVSPIVSNEHLVLSHRGFLWFVTAITGGASAYWVLIDSIRLRRALREDRALAPVRDRIFGSIIGLTIAAIGLVGAYLGSP